LPLNQEREAFTFTFTFTFSVLIRLYGTLLN
jgi:hypothetical protein